MRLGNVAHRCIHYATGLVPTFNKVQVVDQDACLSEPNVLEKDRLGIFSPNSQGDSLVSVVFSVGDSYPY